MMKNICESLAGRVGIIDLSGLSSVEIEKRDVDCFHQSLEHLRLRESVMSNNSADGHLARKAHKPVSVKYTLGLFTSLLVKLLLYGYSIP